MGNTATSKVYVAVLEFKRDLDERESRRYEKISPEVSEHMIIAGTIEHAIEIIRSHFPEGTNLMAITALGECVISTDRYEVK